MPFDKISRGIFVGSEDAKMGYGHKKRSNALPQPLLTLNLILIIRLCTCYIRNY